MDGGSPWGALTLVGLDGRVESVPSWKCREWPGSRTMAFVPGEEAACSRGLSAATPPEEMPTIRNPGGVPAGWEEWGRLGFPEETPRVGAGPCGGEDIALATGIAGTPPGFRFRGNGDPVVSLRSTTGYMLGIPPGCVGKGGAVVSLRSTTGYRLGIPPGSMSLCAYTAASRVGCGVTFRNIDSGRLAGVRALR